jgi:uncharacterized protein YkwD
MISRRMRILCASAIASFVATFALSVPSAPAAVVGNCTPPASWGLTRQDLVPALLVLVNQHRASLATPAPAVVFSPTLARAAYWKSRHMAYYKYMAHDDKGLRTWIDRFDTCGHTTGTRSENVAYGFNTPAAVMTAWLNSPGHRANIENPAFTVVGFAAARSNTGVYYWTQTFGSANDSIANGVPVANANFFAMNEDTVKNLVVKGNDSDPNGDRFDVVSAFSLQGSAKVTPSGIITFKPKANFFGTAKVGYKIADIYGATDTAIATVTVRAVAN